MLPSDFTRIMFGTFSGLDDIQASPWANAEVAPVVVSGVAELSGALLVQRWHETRSAGVFEVLNVFMDDPTTGEVLLYSFDTLGFPAEPPARGRWRDGQIHLLRQTERGHACITFRTTADGFSWTKTHRPGEDHPWTAVVDGALTREPDHGRCSPPGPSLGQPTYHPQGGVTRRPDEQESAR